MKKIKKYDISVKFITTVEFPVIKAGSKREAVEKAEILLLTNKDLEESQDHLPIWEADKLVDD